MKVIQILKKEHYLILQVVDLLARSRDYLEKGVIVPSEFYEKAMHFCNEFADRYLVRPVNDGKLLIPVADGLDGEPGGRDNVTVVVLKKRMNLHAGNRNNSGKYNSLLQKLEENCGLLPQIPGPAGEFFL